MKITYYSSTTEILTEFGNRVKTLRLSENMTQKELAERAGLSVRTLVNMESGKETSFSTVIAVLQVLNRVESIDLLIPEQETRPNAYLVREKAPERARKKKETKPKTGWKWGDES